MKEIINALEENDILMDIDCLDGREKKIKYLLSDNYDMTGAQKN